MHNLEARQKAQLTEARKCYSSKMAAIKAVQPLKTYEL